MTQTLTTFTTKQTALKEVVNGPPVTLRPFSQQDTALQRDFFAALSNESLHLRFMTPVREVSESRLQRLSQVDDRSHYLLMATVVTNGQEKMIAEARFIESDDSSDICEFAICVSDSWRGRGLAHRLLERLEHHACRVGFNRIVAETFAHNRPMIEFGKSAGYGTVRNVADLTRTHLTKALTLAGHAWRVPVSAPQTAAA